MVLIGFPLSKYDTGEYVGTYDCYVECAKHLNIGGGHINQVISGKRNHVGGYTFV